MRTLFLIAAAAFLVAGCGGGGGGSAVSAKSEPVAEKPTDIWEGITYHNDGTEHDTTCLVTEGRDLRCMNDEGMLIFGSVVEKTAYASKPAVAVAGKPGPGSAQATGKGLREVTGDFRWAYPMGEAPANLTSGKGTLTCLFEPHESLECTLWLYAEEGGTETGKLMLFHKDFSSSGSRQCLISKYVRQNDVAGDWAPRDGDGPVLSIDPKGRAFCQNGDTGCVMTGTVLVQREDYRPTDSPYNVYKVELLVEACTHPLCTEFSGTTVRGFAFLDDTEIRGDTLVMMVSGRGEQHWVGIGRRYRRL